jgi:hypothetical protein
MVGLFHLRLALAEDLESDQIDIWSFRQRERFGVHLERDEADLASAVVRSAQRVTAADRRRATA